MDWNHLFKCESNYSDEELLYDFEDIYQQIKERLIKEILCDIRGNSDYGTLRSRDTL